MKAETERGKFEKAERMENRMNMQGLLAVLEEDEADLVGRRETRFAPVPLTGVQQRCC